MALDPDGDGSEDGVAFRLTWKDAAGQLAAVMAGRISQYRGARTNDEVAIAPALMDDPLSADQGVAIPTDANAEASFICPLLFQGRFIAHKLLYVWHTGTFWQTQRRAGLTHGYSGNCEGEGLRSG
jgi:hypothetical protein